MFADPLFADPPPLHDATLATSAVMSNLLKLFSGVQRAAQSSNAPHDPDTSTGTVLPKGRSHTPRPQRGTKRKNPFDKVVSIVVADDDCVKTFQIHNGTLCDKSHYFETAIEREPETSSFSFPHEEPDIFERVQNWMYGKGYIYEEDISHTGHLEIGSTQSTQDDENVFAQLEPLRVAGCLNERGEVITKIAHVKTVPGGLDSDDEEYANAFDVHDEDDDEGAHKPERSDPPTPLDTLTLSKIYTLAEQLEMPELCNEIIEVLGKRLGHDKATPSHALVYAFQRSKINSPLRELLVDYTSRSAPIDDMLDDTTFDTDECTPELLRALVKKLGEVRGTLCFSEAEWLEHFEMTVHRYVVKVKYRK